MRSDKNAARGDPAAFFFFECSTFEQRQHVLGQLIGLRDHRCACLLQDL